jgi:hypothetical protein
MPLQIALTPEDGTWTQPGGRSLVLQILYRLETVYIVGSMSYSFCQTSSATKRNAMILLPVLSD